MQSKRLIVTADDFGYSEAVNEAVLRAHREGILRHASLLVTGAAAVEAARRARAECPELGVGLHLNLCFGASATDCPELAPGGRFPDDPARCGARYFFDGGLERLLERELRAQFERFLALGLAPSHVDGHLNIHVHPVLWPMVLRLSREHGFRRIRLPGGELRRSLTFSPLPFAAQAGQGALFAGLRAYLLRKEGTQGLEVAGRTWGLLRSGLMAEPYLLHLLRGVPPGTTEVYLHPTSDPAMLPRGGPTATHHSFLELQALCSPRARRVIEEEGIELI